MNNYNEKKNAEASHAGHNHAQGEACASGCALPSGVQHAAGGFPYQLTDAQWKEKLTPMQYKVLRQSGTERAFSGQYNTNKQAGTYACAGCGEALFAHSTKFNSGTGWPSFTQPIKGAPVGETVDSSHGMVRTEVHCSNCGGHLGHVFPDGPRQAGGLRYCINSAALNFVAEAE